MSRTRQPDAAPYTRDQLLAVAAGVFLRRGYDGTSMEDLARATGLAKSSLYHHVAGKDELLRATTGRALDALEAILDEPGSRTGRSIDQFTHVVRRTAETLVAELPYVSVLLRVRGNTPSEREALARRRAFDRRVAGMLAAAARAGDVRTGVEPHLATRLVFGMINSAVEWYSPRGGRAGEFVDGVCDLVFGGLRAVSGSGAAGPSG